MMRTYKVTGPANAISTMFYFAEGKRLLLPDTSPRKLRIDYLGDSKAVVGDPQLWTVEWTKNLLTKNSQN